MKYLSNEYLGILVSNSVYQGIPYKRTGYENIAFYEEAAKKNGISLCFFRRKDIHAGQSEITAYVQNEDSGYKKVIVSAPNVIHNRGLYFSKKTRAVFSELQKEGKILYNPWNRYPKLEVYKLLMRDKKLHENLPKTKIATRDSVLNMLTTNNQLIIKPNSSSLGYNLMKIEKHKEFVLTLYSRKKKSWVDIKFTNEIPPILQRKLSGRLFVVQEYIPLAKYCGCVYDLRISCQKNGEGKWQVTGVVGRVARGEIFVTNVARGGKAYPFDALLDGSLNKVHLLQKIEGFSTRAAGVLEEEYPGLADLGLDVGITNNGSVKFIECNCRDLRYSFRNAGLYKTWKAAFTTPIDYGNYLLKKEG